MPAKKSKKSEEAEQYAEDMASGVFFTRSERTCGHASMVQDYLDMRGRQYKVGPQPHSERCLTCLGPYTDEQVLDRQRWQYQLLHSIHIVHKKGIVDQDIRLWRALRLKFAGQEAV